MKSLKISLIFFLLMTFGSELYAQGGRHHRRHRHPNVAVVKRSAHRPAKVIVYHPHWRPTYAYHRRWVYFPRYNLYWDNWRNQYLFWNGALWISQVSAPPAIINVNLEKEKSVELPEGEEDEDDIYKSNNTHQRSYKTE